MNDVRTPADPQDFETTYSVTPLPPKDFRVTSVSGTTTFRVLDRLAGEGKGAAASYRIYWIPSGLSPSGSVTEAERGALVRMGKLVATITATRKGDALSATASDMDGKTGKFLCVGANVNGEESPSSAIAISPWGAA